MIRKGRAGVALAALACLLLVLSGCTSDPAAGGPAPAPGAPAAGTVVADAVNATLGAGSARATIDLASPLGAVTATGPVRFTPFAADLSATLPTGPVAVRTVDGRSWVRFGPRWRTLPPGLVPVGALGGALHAGPALRDVVADGPDPVDGAPATRYHGTADLDAAAAADPASADGIRELSGLVSSRPGVEIWIGSDGRVARIRLTPSGPSAGGPVTVGLTDLGLPVDVVAPA